MKKVLSPAQIVKDKEGFELSDKGTLFLDEIFDMPMALQAKL